MKLYFVTSNKNKVEEARELLKGYDVEQLDIDLPEIQSLDGREIVGFKLKEALKHKAQNLIVEDTSLLIDGMNGLPGPLIRWFKDTVGVEGLYKLSKVFGDKAQAKVVLGFAKSSKELFFFEGRIDGRIVAPRGNKRFFWDQVFIPEGGKRRFSEMTIDEKNRISHRRRAFLKLKKFLSRN